MESKSSVNFHKFGEGDPAVLVDSRVHDLSNHVGFTDVAAPRVCWQTTNKHAMSKNRK
jgi:hypothetical protein